MKRWTHVHSGSAGALLALAVAHDARLVLVGLVLAFCAGWFAQRLAVRARMVAAAIAAKATELHNAKVKTEQARATELRTRQKNRRRTKAEQDRELDRAYVRGATDQLHHAQG